MTDPLPLVSVLIASQGDVKALELSIRSVLNQDYPRIDLIVGVSDLKESTCAMLNFMQEADDRVRWFSAERCSGGHLLNRASLLARGSLLGCLISGEIFTLGAFRRAVQAFKDFANLSVVYGQVRYVNAIGAPIHTLPSLHPPDRGAGPSLSAEVSLATVFIQRYVRIVVGEFDERSTVAVDADYLQRIFNWFPNRIGFVDAVQAECLRETELIPAVHAPVQKLIRPQEIIGQYSLHQHLQLADRYFHGRENHAYLYQKPFVHPQDCGPMLSNLGQLFAGAKLQTGMRVLDFAAGSCWLSRILVQMGCLVTSCDASTIALEIGKELFRKYPPVAEQYCAPDFCVFDGETLPFADASFDRIVVNDAFHHVPNMATVLAEFARVLKPDGMVAMSEPGRHHSRTEESQFEMKTFQVIENDVVLEDLWDMARGLGFADIRIRPTLRTPDMGMADYLQCIQGAVPPAVLQGVAHGTLSHSIFFLYKQVWQPFVHPTDAQDQAQSRDEFDEAFYLERYPDIAEVLALGHFADAWQHYDRHGRQEGRRARFM